MAERRIYTVMKQFTMFMLMILFGLTISFSPESGSGFIFPSTGAKDDILILYVYKDHVETWRHDSESKAVSLSRRSLRWYYGLLKRWMQMVGAEKLEDIPNIYIFSKEN